MSQGVLIDVAPYAGNDDDDVRYTLDDADAWLRSKAGVDAWDLDVAGCTESHRAEYFYTLERSEDGLTHAWSLPRIFCNPPWSCIEPWIERGIDTMHTEFDVDVIGYLLPLRTHMRWWQKWIEPRRDSQVLVVPGTAKCYRVDVHHPPTRFRYGCPGNPRGVGVPEPNFQTVGIVFRRCS